MTFFKKMLSAVGGKKQDRRKEGTNVEKVSNSSLLPLNNLSNNPSLPAIPTTHCNLDQFTVHQTLGTGSFGRVLLVQHLVSKEWFAMKKLRKSDVLRLKQVEHTNNERSLLAKIEHPFIVNMKSTFQDERHLYIILDFVSGGEMFTLLRKVRTLPPFVAQFYSAQVILAIEYLHSMDIIYRDLKPENILIGQDGNLKLTDFGFAKVVDENTWTLCGTPDYLAPEVVLSRGYGLSVDWYAVGVLIYEMLIGMPPFYNENQMKLYESIVNDPIRYPTGFDPVAKDLISRLMNKNPTNRLGSLAGGSEDIKRHPWFADVKWDLILQMKVKPPYKPKVQHPGDSSNFDKYPEETPEHSQIPSDAFRDLFPLF